MIEYTNIRETLYYLNFIFNGQMFSLRTAYSIAASETVMTQFKTPADKVIHISQRNIIADGGGPYNVQLVENPTPITNGTPMPPNVFSNMDRRSTKQASLQVFLNPTDVGGGTVIDVDYIPTGANATNKGSAVYTVSDIERILKPDTNYVLSITNAGTQSGNVLFHLLQYESDN